LDAACKKLVVAKPGERPELLKAAQKEAAALKLSPRQKEYAEYYLKSLKLFTDKGEAFLEKVGRSGVLGRFGWTAFLDPDQRFISAPLDVQCARTARTTHPYKHHISKPHTGVHAALQAALCGPPQRLRCPAGGVSLAAEHPDQLHPPGQTGRQEACTQQAKAAEKAEAAAAKAEAAAQGATATQAGDEAKQ